MTDPAPAAPELMPLGEILTSATSIVLDRPGVFLTMWAATGLPAFLIKIAAVLSTGLGTAESVKAAAIEGRWGTIATVAGIGILAGMIESLGFVAAQMASADCAAGREPEPLDALGRAVSRYPAVLWTGFVVGLRILLGLLLLIIPGLVLAVRYGFSNIVAALEGISGGAAASRSQELVIPHMGKIMGNSAVIFLLTMVGVAVLHGLGNFGSGLAQMFIGRGGAVVVEAAAQGVVSLMMAWMSAAGVVLYLTIAAAHPRANA